MKPLRIGILGLGTVAQGVLHILKDNAALLTARAGRPVVASRVASRRPRPEVDLGTAVFSTDTAALTVADDVDIVVECIGGEQPCLDLLNAALGAGKSVVTANKALIASHGDALHALASRQGVSLTYEAAVAGGIPILNALSAGLAANRIEWIAGIINGTSNYILTAMAEQGQSFADALSEAQRLGYAEADPTFDIEGIDAAHKLTILAGLGFGRPFDFAAVATEGIAAVAPIDIEYARRLGYVIKHLGIARQRQAAGGIEVEARVHPALVPMAAPLAQVNGVTNAVMIGGNAVGSTVYMGPGAGMLPTASAIVADVVGLARGQRPAPRILDAGRFQSDVQADAAATMAAAEDGAFYLRLQVTDRPGVFARVTTLLSEAGISIEAALQQEHTRQQARARPTDGTVPIVLLTQPTSPARLEAALVALRALPDMVAEVRVLRVEALGD